MAAASLLQVVSSASEDPFAELKAEAAGVERRRLRIDASMLTDDEVLSSVSYWICVVSVNQHRTICGSSGTPGGPPARDSVSGEVYPLCECGLEKFFGGDVCEVNKFDDLLAVLKELTPGFSQVVAVDRKLEFFTRASGVAELVEGRAADLEQG